MTTNRAIRRLRSFLKWRKKDPDDDFWESVEAGMEALIEKQKREKRGTK